MKGCVMGRLSESRDAGYFQTQDEIRLGGYEVSESFDQAKKDAIEIEQGFPGRVVAITGEPGGGEEYVAFPKDALQDEKLSRHEFSGEVVIYSS